MFEPPYGVIWNRLKTGMVVPFLGAGASFVGRVTGMEWNPNQSTFYPSGKELSHLLATETSFPSTQPRDSDDLAKVVSYFVDENSRHALREQLSQVLASDFPRGALYNFLNDLSQFLATEKEFPSAEERDRDDLAKVSSYYAEVNGRPILRGRLRDLLARNFMRGAVHDFLASVPHPLVIVSTNYDTFIEQAFLAANKPYDLVIYPADRKDIANAVLWWQHNATEPKIQAPNELDIDLEKTTVIYKMHGTINPDTAKWDNFVITEEDYIEFLSRMTANTAVPSLFFEHFRERSFLFLGYSLSDWNLRVILKNLTKLLPAKGGDDISTEIPPSYAVQYQPSALESKLWERRNVSIFDLTIDDFVAKMNERKT